MVPTGVGLKIPFLAHPDGNRCIETPALTRSEKAAGLCDETGNIGVKLNSEERLRAKQKPESKVDGFPASFAPSPGRWHAQFNGPAAAGSGS
jgi:hypothetical protein